MLSIIHIRMLAHFNEKDSWIYNRSFSSAIGSTFSFALESVIPPPDDYLVEGEFRLLILTNLS